MDTSNPKPPALSPLLLSLLTDDAVRRSVCKLLVRAPKLRLRWEDAEDAFQLALEQALRTPPIETTTDALRGWLFTVARNKALDGLRHQEIENIDPDARLDRLPEKVPRSGPGPLERWMKASLPGKHAADTVDCLLAQDDGATVEELAAERGIPANRLRQRLHAARAFLEKHRDEARKIAGLLGLLLVLRWAALPGESEQVGTASPPPVATGRVEASPAERSAAMRSEGLEACERGKFRLCLERLDAAERIWPGSAADPQAREARRAALRALGRGAGEPSP